MSTVGYSTPEYQALIVQLEERLNRIKVERRNQLKPLLGANPCKFMA